MGNEKTKIDTFKTGAGLILGVQKSLGLNERWAPKVKKDDIMTEAQMGREFNSFGRV